MMFIADFHIHSKYSRATSKECVPEALDKWARRKGLDVIGTGDFTHPAWREELKEKLVPAEEGLYTLRKDLRAGDIIEGGNPRFIVSGEISSIYKKNGKVRKVHNLILLPSIEDAQALSRRLEAIGNLHSDGRPILGLDSRDLLEIALETAPGVIFIPAHIWTPHFSLFGAYSGFDDIKECFEDLTEHIHALETGLSSDPPMNRRLSKLDGFNLVSNSDAHSPSNLAREANIFDTNLSYGDISHALETGRGFGGTIEFFPEEGKYHYDGHRNCGVCLPPSETRAAGGVCPVCGGRITVGVLSRVEALADREEGFVPPGSKKFESLVQLNQVIASSMGMTPSSVKVKSQYEKLLQNIGPELFILREAPLEDIEHKAGVLIAEGIRRLRSGEVEIRPGYDGEYGKIKLLDRDEIILFSGQLSMFEEKQVADNTKGNGKSESKSEIPVMADIRPVMPVSPERPLNLNSEQQGAVSAPDKYISVIAGPGTGKTRTLVSRIAYLIEKCGVKPSQITAVTFTNKAAAEMRARLEKQFGKRPSAGITIGTFHSIALKILSEKTGASPTIIDEQNALSIIEDILKGLGITDPPRDVMREISLIKNSAKPEGDARVPPGVYAMYCEKLAQYGVLDYDDILLDALKIAEGGDSQNTKGFTHLLVDEFQDINALQYRLIKAWSKNSSGVFIIGDPDQSIYGFRGSDSRFFSRFSKDFPGTQGFSLTRNYRSTPEIIRCAQSIILNKSAESRIRLQEAGRESGAKVRVLEAESAFSEALFIAKEINRLVGGIEMTDTGSDSRKQPFRVLKSFSDIAVLYRTNRQAGFFEECLLKEGIPYSVAGRDEYLSDPKVRNAIAFFRFLLHPKDLLSLRLCLKGAGVPDTLGIPEIYSAVGKSISSITAVLKNAGSPAVGFAELLKKYGLLVRKEKPQALIESWINDNSLSGTPCMDMLLNTSVMYEDMNSFLQNLLLGRESDVVRSGAKRYSLDAVTLTTLHGSKGLEFPVVFLCGATDGLIPFRDRFGHCNADEERRLFYVGITRAKDELLILTSKNPSPYFKELPEEPLIRGQAMEQKTSPSEQIKFF